MNRCEGSTDASEFQLVVVDDLHCPAVPAGLEPMQGVGQARKITSQTGKILKSRFQTVD